MKTKKNLALTLFSGLMLLNLATYASSNVTSSIKVYPTPSHEKLVIESAENGYLRILDANGMLVKETPIYKGETAFKLSEMKAQKYVLQVKTAGETVVKRLLVR